MLNPIVYLYNKICLIYISKYKYFCNKHAIQNTVIHMYGIPVYDKKTLKHCEYCNLLFFVCFHLKCCTENVKYHKTGRGFQTYLEINPSYFND